MVKRQSHLIKYKKKILKRKNRWNFVGAISPSKTFFVSFEDKIRLDIFIF